MKMNKRLLSMILVVVMVLGMIPLNAIATDETDPIVVTHIEGCGAECAVEGCACTCHQVMIIDEDPTVPCTLCDGIFAEDGETVIHNPTCLTKCNCTPVDGVHVAPCVLAPAAQEDEGGEEDPLCDKCNAVKNEDGTLTHEATCEFAQSEEPLCNMCEATKDENGETVHADGCKGPCECEAVIDGVHSNWECPYYVEPLEKCEHCQVELTEGAVHADTCLSFCTCDPKPTEGEAHKEGCKFYAAPVEKCEFCQVELTEGAVHADTCLSFCTCDPKPAEGEAHKEGCKLYVAPVVVTKESFIEDVAIQVTGNIPEEVKLTTTYVPEPSVGMFKLFNTDIKFNEAIYDFIGEGATIAFTVDITLTNPDGTVWQPAEGETVDVAVDLSALDLEERIVVQIIHEHEGELNDLGMYPVENGKLTFPLDGFSKVYIIDISKTEGNPYRDNILDGVMYYDLSAGPVIVRNTWVQGYRFDGNGTPKWFDNWIYDCGDYKTIEDVKIYIYQSGGNTQTGYFDYDKDGDKELVLPEYDPITYNGQSWKDFITNNNDVEEVINAWNAADKGGRVATKNWINIYLTGGITADITIDNLWSTYQQVSRSRQSGGIFFINGDRRTAELDDTTYNDDVSGKAIIRLKGDNRFGNIYYEGHRSDNRKQLIFTDAAGDGQAVNSLTVANFSPDVGEQKSGNYYNTAIGGSDSRNRSSYGLVFNGGVVYAGTTVNDNATAIGGGGDWNGGITINGGKVTAVASTAGTAIGGGMSTYKTSSQMNGDVMITGGEVYAYNFGPYNSPRYDEAENMKCYYAPATAIGSGSSHGDSIGPARINISGGKIFAYSVGGTAIGGGSSALATGGSATINITGGDITALSTPIPESVYSKIVNAKQSNYPAATGIGGGIGAYNGGICTVNISGSNTVVRTGSIGGGRTLNPASYKNGYADVRIENGATVHGQVIMGKGTAQPGTLTINNATINNSKDFGGNHQYYYIRENGGVAFIENGSATVTNSTIIGGGTDGVLTDATPGNLTDDVRGNHIQNGGAFYINGGSFTMNSGTIKDCIATVDGGAVYVSGGICNLDGGSIQNNTAENGGAVYVKGGTCNLNGGTLYDNHAEQNGGAVYVTNTGVKFGGTDGITIQKNTADENGGGLYISQTGGQETSIATGRIYENDAAGNGGGIFHIGNGVCTISGLSEIRNNEAANGGGLYIDNGSHLKVEGGSVNYNNAVGTPDTNVDTAYADNANRGVGGGIYVASGSVDSSKFDMDQSDEESGIIVGIYMNKAQFAANDVYANKDATILKLPSIQGMVLAPGIQATGWYEDYAKDDSEYDEGYVKNTDYTTDIDGVDRYEKLANTQEVTEVNNTEVTGKYLCLTIGVTRFGKAKLTIQKQGGTVDTDDVFYFTISSERFDDFTESPFEMTVAIQGTGLLQIEQLPYGDYTIKELNHWRYEPTTGETMTNGEYIKKVTLSSANNEEGVVFTNVRTNNQWLDDTADPKVNVTGRGHQ